jgi:hypothetical protein
MSITATSLQVQRQHGRCAGDPLVCGLYGDDCEACRGPTPRAAPGQPCTLAEQLALVVTPRQAPGQVENHHQTHCESRLQGADLVEMVEDIVRRLLVEELPAAVSYLIEIKEGHHDA